MSEISSSFRQALVFILDPVRGRDHDNLWNTCGWMEGIDDSLHRRSTIVRKRFSQLYLSLYLELCFLSNQGALKSGRFSSKILQQSTLLQHKLLMWLMLVSQIQRGEEKPYLIDFEKNAKYFQEGSPQLLVQIPKITSHNSIKWWWVTFLMKS